MQPVKRGEQVSASYTEPSEIVVHRPTPDEAREALEAAIAETGFTREELEEQARAGRFETELARQTWCCLPPRAE